MALSDFFLHFQAIVRRVGQVLFSLAVLWLGHQAYSSDFEIITRWWLIGAVTMFGLLVLIVWEFKVLKSYGFTLFPPGWGTLRPQRYQGIGRFLSLLELASRFRWKPGGILLGRVAPQHRLFGLPRDLRIGPVDDRHMLTIAGARSGKGTAALIPNLLIYPGSALVVDPKGELAQITATRRARGSKRVTQSLGQHVFILDPEDIVVGLPKARWNPLAELNLADPHLWGHVARISLAVVPPKGVGGDDEFFISQARDLLTALIVHVVTVEPPERRNLIFVRKLLTQGDRDLFAMVEEECRNSGKPVPFADPLSALLEFMVQNRAHSGKASGIAQRLLGLAEETRTSVIGTLVEQTSFLDHHSMERTLQCSDFSLTDLKKSRMTVYLCVKGTSLAGSLAKLVYLLIDLAISKMEEIPGKPPHNVLFAIDEFYCLGRSEAIDRAMGLMAGFGLTLWPILQHIGQLQRHYPDTWDNFIRNCRAVQYFGDLAPDLLRELEKRLGERIVRKRKGVEERQPLIPFNELSSHFFVRESRRQLVFFQQQPAAILELIDHYNSFSKSMYEDDCRGIRSPT